MSEVPLGYQPLAAPYASPLACGTVMRQFSVQGPCRGRGALGSGQRTMKTLDGLLYRWVGEADESRGETAFRTYYSAAFPLLVRHVQHRTGWDSASAEDIAQEALVRFFERIGRGRRDAIAVVRAAAARLADLDAGPLATGLIARWAGNVDALASSVADFCLSGEDRSPDEYCRELAGELSTQISSLQRAGLGLLYSMRPLVSECIAGGREDESETPAMVPGTLDSLAAAKVGASEIVGFARELAHSLSTDPLHVSAGGRRDPGIAAPVQAVLMIIETLPRLRMPTNSYLFEITTSTFLDEIKRRKRKKRGGAATDAGCASDDDAHDERGTSGHPLEAIPEDLQTESDGDSWHDQHCPRECRHHSRTATVMLVPSVDPIMGYESEDFLRRFYEYLRVPVARAVTALETARAEGPALPERRRLESVAGKFSRMVTVLSLLGEGYTQEEAARLAGLSRNQVKYIAQTVKEAYERFAAGETRAAQPGANREGGSHVS